MAGLWPITSGGVVKPCAPARALFDQQQDQHKPQQQSGKLGSGATVSFDAGPRLNTWFVADDQLIQHSDTAKPDTMSLQENSARRLAGRWSVSGGVGAVGTVQFDAPLAKVFNQY